MILIKTENNQAGACLTVNRGSSSDPVEYQGLAHFLEHMLFISTEKYPEIEDYRKKVTKYNGYCNAFTSFNLTCYYFNVNKEGLMETIDSFAQFFICSLF